MPLRLAVGLAQSFIASGAADADRVYVAGLSMGGMGTFEAAGRFPDLFAAAIPICGGGDMRAFGDAKRKLPIRIFHGAIDSVVDYRYSWEMYDSLKRIGWPVEYVEYPAVDHNSWDYAFAERDFLAWLFSKKKG